MRLDFYFFWQKNLSRNIESEVKNYLLINGRQRLKLCMIRVFEDLGAKTEDFQFTSFFGRLNLPRFLGIFRIKAQEKLFSQQRKNARVIFGKSVRSYGKQRVLELNFQYRGLKCDRECCKNWNSKRFARKKPVEKLRRLKTTKSKVEFFFVKIVQNYSSLKN